MLKNQSRASPTAPKGVVGCHPGHLSPADMTHKLQRGSMKHLLTALSRASSENTGCSFIPLIYLGVGGEYSPSLAVSVEQQ